MYTPPEFCCHIFGKTKHIVRTKSDTGAIDTECGLHYGPNSIAQVPQAHGVIDCYHCKRMHARLVNKKIYEPPVLRKGLSKAKRNLLIAGKEYGEYLRKKELAKLEKFTGQKVLKDTNV